MHRFWIAVTLTGVAISAPTIARAADSREVREREARKACFTGNVDRGVEILVDLYGETGHPNYIYNQARCFERNGKYDQALLSYEDYLRKATNLPEADKAQVEKSIAELRAKVNAPQPPTVSGTTGTGGPPLLTPSFDAAAPPPAKTTELLSPPSHDDKPRDAGRAWQRTAGTVALIVAGGGLALGVAGHVLRESRAGDFNDACTYVDGQPMPRVISSGVDCRGKYDSVQGAQRMMWIGYAGAGVFAAAGVTLLLLAPRADRAGAMAWARRCGPTLGTTGVVCGWQF